MIILIFCMVFDHIRPHKLKYDYYFLNISFWKGFDGIIFAYLHAGMVSWMEA